MSVQRGLVHDPYLVGNGAWCSCCFPDGGPVTGGSFVDATRWSQRIRPGCNECADAGRITFTAEQIVAETVAAKRQSKERRP